MGLFSVAEVVMMSLSAGALLGYHLHLFFQVRRRPLSTTIGITNHARWRWVRSVMAERRDILAVQTLRNWVMAANFLASTAVLISLGLLASAFRPDVFQAVNHALNLYGAVSETLWMVKLLAFAGLFFYAFINFTLAIRYYNHASLLINIPENGDATVTAEVVTDVLNHGALHYTLGMRGFYLAMPLGLWFFGPAWMLAGTVFLIPVLYRLDREV